MATSTKKQRPTVATLSRELGVPVRQVLTLAGQIGSSARGESDQLDLDEAEAIRRAAYASGISAPVKGEVIELRDAEVRAQARSDLGPLLDRTELFETLQRFGSDAQKIASEQVSGMSAKAFDTQLVGDSTSLESRLIDAEVKGVLAKNGLKPEGTIEHLSAFRELLAAAYSDSHLVEPTTQLKVMQIDVDIQKIEASRATVVLTHQHSEELKLLQVRTAKEVEQAKAGATVATAKADSHVEKVRAVGKTRSADIDIDLMNDVKRTEAIKKKLANRRARQRTVWREGVKPKIRLALMVAVPLILAANLVADGPGRENTPVLGPVNSAWDAVYAPLRDGVVRSFTDLKQWSE